MSERIYYDTVRKWLERDDYYCGGPKRHEFFYELGVNYAKPDVAGIKNLTPPEGEFVDEIIISVIEVKDLWNLTERDVSQAKRYLQMAHLAYVANTGEIRQDAIEYAKREGIGILKIQTKDKVKVIYNPVKSTIISEGKMLAFLHKMNIYQCTFCRCYYYQELDGEQSDCNIHRPKIFHSKNPKNDPYDIYIELPWDKITYRSLCPQCVVDFFPQLLPETKRKRIVEYD